MRILVTGITGFVGCHLAEALLADRDVVLFGSSRRAQWPSAWQHLAGKVDVQACDLCDRAATENMVRETRPEQIYHLAGFANPRHSRKEPDAAWAGNLTGTRSLYDAVVGWGGKPRIVYVGSGLVYGESTNPEEAFTENAELRPTTPYASSKAAADLMSYQYTRPPTGLDIVRVRPFNHAGPGQPKGYVTADFAEQIAAIEKGQRPFMQTLDLSSQRDLTDVRDMVQAYRLLMQHGRTGEAYNAGTGEAHSMQELLDHLLSLSRVRIDVRPQAGLMRAAEKNVVRAEPSKLQRETGWRPRFTLQQTLADILEYWRRQS